MTNHYHSRSELERIGKKIRDKAIATIAHMYELYKQQGFDPQNGGNLLFRGSMPSLPFKYSTRAVAPGSEELSSYLHGCYDDIPSLFTAFSGSNPADCQPTIDSLHEVAFMLHPDLKASMSGGKLNYPIPENFSWQEEPIADRIRSIDHLRDGWRGKGADSFDSYLSHFPTSVGLQHDLAVALAVSLDAYREILSRSYKNIWSIGQGTLQALDTLYDCHPKSASVAYTVVGAIASVAAEFATDGLATPLVVAGAAGGLVGGVLGAASGPPKATIGGGSVPTVISQMREAMIKLRRLIDDQNDLLKYILQRVSDKVDDFSASKELEIPAPDGLNALSHAGHTTLSGQNGFYIP